LPGDFSDPTDFVSGVPKGSDDIAEVKWFSLHEANEMMLVKETAPEHFRNSALS